MGPGPQKAGGDRCPLTVMGMGVFSRHVDAVVVALSWKRTVVVEQGRWVSRRTAWKPYGGNVRNIRAVKSTEADVVFNMTSGGSPGDIPRSQASAVTAKHTYFEYEELEWHRRRSFSAEGDGPAGVRWPEPALEPDQRVSERRESYRAKLSAGADDGGDEYVTELDEATWRTLRVGLACRLTVGAFTGEVKHLLILRRTGRSGR
jgi:hypothetical protein